jgi:hypothetical protein
VIESILSGTQIGTRHALRRAVGMPLAVDGFSLNRAATNVKSGRRGTVAELGSN